MNVSDSDESRRDHGLDLGTQVAFGGSVTITPVACACGQWTARGVSKTSLASSANATEMHGKHVDDVCGPMTVSTDQVEDSTTAGPDATEKISKSDAVVGSLVLTVVGALAVGFLWVVGSALFGGGGDEPATVYDDTECSAIIGFAKHDDVLVSERQDALDEYTANC